MSDLKTAARELALSFNLIQTWLGGENRIDPETFKEYKVEGNWNDFVTREQLEQPIISEVI